jgi:putative ABC transport system ATP-binding protein
MISLRGVTYAYPGGRMLAFPDWQLGEGVHALLLGVSGSGKTTLLHLLAGLLAPQQGEVTVGGQSLGALGEAQRDRWRGQNIGLVFQQLHMLKALTVAQNLLLAPYAANLPQDAARANEVMDHLSISALAQRRPSQLSHGQAQRAAIARAVMNRPKFLFADEPTSALDDVNAHAVAELLLAQAHACGASLVIGTHDARLRPLIPHVLALNA